MTRQASTWLRQHLARGLVARRPVGIAAERAAPAGRRAFFGALVKSRPLAGTSLTAH